MILFQNVLSGPQTAQDTLWNVGKEQHVPKVTTFTTPDASTLANNLDSTQYGPTTQQKGISVSIFNICTK